MKIEWRMFGAFAAFLLLACGIYAWWTWYESGQVEAVGTVALFLSFALAAMVTGYFWVIARRIDLRPEDLPEAEISDGAGVIGFFSPGSYYPFGIGLAAMVAGLGLALLQWWLVAAGVVGLVLASSGMLFEYHTGSRRTASQ